MKTGERILHIIKREGRVTAKQIADLLDMTTMGARQHLQALEDDSLLAIEDIRVKVGRPTRHWSLTAKGHRHFADRHGELTIQVIDAVERLYGLEGVEKVTLDRESQTLAHYQAYMHGCETLEAKLKALVEIREQEGYMAEFEACDGGYLFTENHCPICRAATHCPSLCQSELNIFRQLLGPECHIERTEHIVRGERRCRYRVVEASS